MRGKDLYIDIGSTYIKYALDDGEPEQIAFPPPVRQDEYLYEVSVEAILDGIGSILTHNPADRVFFSVQMHGYILSDENHVPVTAYVSWRDTLFGSLHCGYPFALAKESGTALKNNLPALSIYARSILYPEAIGRAAYFDTLGSYIVFRLTGNHLVHITDACPSGFYLLPSGAINPALKNFPVFRRLVFPRAESEVCAAGSYGTTTVYVAVGDQQASAFGVGLTTREYLFNTGTAGQLCCLSDDFQSGDFESRPYFEGRCLCTVTGLAGGGSCSDLAAFEERITEEYRSALTKLPVRRRALSTGGLVKYNEALFKKICENLVGEYRYVDGQNAIHGLKKLSRCIMKKSGIMLSEIAFAHFPVLFKNSGLDFFILDGEHGGFDYADISRIVMNARLAGIPVIIRLPGNMRKDIIKFMDMGRTAYCFP